MILYIWSVTIWKNIGTEGEPNWNWIKENRYYYGRKKIEDFDLYTIPLKRKDSAFLGLTTDKEMDFI